MTIIQKTAYFLLISFFLSCSSHLDSPEGNIITQEISDINGFISLDLNGAFDVEFSYSESTSVSAETFESVIPYLIITNIGSDLLISLDKACPFEFIEPLKIKITSPELYIVNAANYANVELASNLATNNFEIHLKSHSSFTINSNVLTTNSVLITMDDASTCILNGTSSSMEAEVKNGSKLISTNFVSKEAKAKISFASTAEFNVSDKYYFHAEAMSSIRFTGNGVGKTFATSSSIIESF